MFSRSEGWKQISCNQTLCHMENHHFSKTVNHLHTWPIFQSYLRLPEGFVSPHLEHWPCQIMSVSPVPRDHAYSTLIHKWAWALQSSINMPAMYGTKTTHYPFSPPNTQKNGVPGLYSICSNQNLLNGEHCQKSCKRQPSVAVPKISAVKKS